MIYDHSWLLVLIYIYMMMIYDHWSLCYIYQMIYDDL